MSADAPTLERGHLARTPYYGQPARCNRNLKVNTCC